MNNIDYELTVKLRIGESLIGPGIIKLLELSSELGSVQEACARMGMAYSKAWKILKEAEEAVGQPLLKRVSGGTGGGSSTLTADGTRLIEGYKAFASKLDRAAQGCFEDYFGR